MEFEVNFLFFILVGLIITFLIASGICYANNYNGKGAMFLAIGVILIICTYRYYESSRNKKKSNHYSGNTNYDACSYLDCGHVLSFPTSGDCSSLEKLTDFDCGSVDCSGGDCHSG